MPPARRRSYTPRNLNVTKRSKSRQKALEIRLGMSAKRIQRSFRKMLAKRRAAARAQAGKRRLSHMSKPSQ